MTKQHLTSDSGYRSPESCQIDILSEGLLCTSTDEKEGENETFSAWNNYENDGWY